MKKAMCAALLAASILAAPAAFGGMPEPHPAQQMAISPPPEPDEGFPWLELMTALGILFGGIGSVAAVVRMRARGE